MISLWFFFSVTVSIFLLSMFRALQFVFTFLFLARRKNRKKNGRSQSNHHHQWEEILIDCLIVSNQPNKKKERNQIIIIIWWIEKIWKENLFLFFKKKWIPFWIHRKSFTCKKLKNYWTPADIIDDDHHHGHCGWIAWKSINQSMEARQKKNENVKKNFVIFFIQNFMKFNSNQKAKIFQWNLLHDLIYNLDEFFVFFCFKWLSLNLNLNIHNKMTNIIITHRQTLLATTRSSNFIASKQSLFFPKKHHNFFPPFFSKQTLFV